MGRLLSIALTSLDGYVADAEGRFDWAAPDEEVHAAVNDLMRPSGTFLIGRRTYEVMTFWDTPAADDDQPDAVRDFAAIWRAADKVVFSRTLGASPGPRATTVSAFDPEGIRAMKASVAGDMTIGGPTLVAAAFAAGLVDEVHLFLAPVVVGGGLPAFSAGLRVDLELLRTRRFASGFVHLHHAVRGGDSAGGGVAAGGGTLTA